MNIQKLKLIEIETTGFNNKFCDFSCDWLEISNKSSKCMLYFTTLPGTNRIIMRCKKCIEEFGGIE